MKRFLIRIRATPYSIPLVFLCCSGPALQAQQYTIQSLGDFTPSSINDQGTVVGQYYAPPNASVAVEWQAGLVSRILPGDYETLALIKINNSDDAVGFFDNFYLDTGSYSAGFLATPNNTTLFVYQMQGTFFPLAINNQGLVVGSLPNYDAGTYNSTTGTFTDLGNFGGIAAQFTAVNDTGQLAGSVSLTVNNTIVRAFVTADGQTQILPSLAGIDDRVNAINDNGLAVGMSESADGNGNAVLWKDGTLIPLSPLAPGDQPDAVGINDSNEIVGNSGDYPVLWDVNGNATNLNTFLPPDSGWILYEAGAINNLGQIVGLGTYDGQPEGFLLTPIPEPAAIPLVLSLCVLTKYRFRKGS